VYKLPDIDGVAALNHINELGLVSRSRAETIADRLISLPPRTLGIPDNSMFVRRRHLSVNMHTYIHTNLYSAKNRENESEALAQDD